MYRPKYFPCTTILTIIDPPVYDNAHRRFEDYTNQNSTYLLSINKEHKFSANIAALFICVQKSHFNS